MLTLPRISIITPSYMQGAYLADCIDSVSSQDHADIEHIVVDGGSTDGSVEVIRSRQERLAWWCSERDQGQSDALNKGLSRATGDVFGWLNSDDLLLPGALSHVARRFAEDADLVMLEGVRLIDDGGLRPAPSNPPGAWRHMLVEPRVNQQSTFFRTSIVRQVEGLDPALHHVMDLELWWRVLFLTQGRGIALTERELAVFRIHDASKTGRAKERFEHEQAGVLHGLCQAVGDDGLARVLGIGYRWPIGIRSMPMAGGAIDAVREMALHFLLKWNRGVYDKVQFERMKALLQWKGLAAFINHPLYRDRIRELEGRMRAPTWTLFRVRRKFKHLLG